MTWSASPPRATNEHARAVAGQTAGTTIQSKEPMRSTGTSIGWLVGAARRVSGRAFW